MKTIFLAMFAALLLAGCAGQVKPTGPEFFQAAGPAVDSLARNLAGQIGRSAMFIKTVPVDSFFDESSGEIPMASAALQVQLATALTTNIAGTAFAPLAPKTLDGARWIVLAGYSTAAVQGRQGAWVKLRVSITEIASGKRLASAESYLAAAAFNAAPTKFFKDAPMYMVDKTMKDKLAALSGVGIQKPIAGLDTQNAYGAAVAAYEAGHYPEAQTQFQAVLATSPGHRGALSGLYQSYWNQGMKKEAEFAFGNLVGTGIDAGGISAKLLFAVGGTGFVSNADLAQQYALWQKVIAQTIVAKNKCMDVVGHASKTGGDSVNDKLSQQRAAKIVGNMQQAVPASRGKLNAVGRGSQQNLVGTGADNDTDAVDRRVEFSVRGCAS